MDRIEVRKHIGKRVLLILKNNFQYTVIIPDFEGDSFSTKDIFNEDVSVTCDFISAIMPKEEK